MRLLRPLLLLLIAFMAVSFGPKPKNQPNVLFLFADDQRADALGVAGNPYIKTPNIDQLAREGSRFTDAYVMGGHHGAICAPSRAMLLSGKSLYHVYDRLDGVETMPMYFAQQGYLTFGTGKWHNEKTAFEASFQQAKSVYLGGMADHFAIAVRDMDANRILGEPTVKGFSTEVFASAAIDFLSDYAQSDRSQPFFCYVAFTVPHDPYSPAPAYIDRYPATSLPLPGNFMGLHPFAFDQLSIRDENLTSWPRKPEVIQAILADYYGLITHLDDQIGKIIETLKSNGLYENTIIVYAADNGLAAGSHGLLGKQNLYEHSTKVPLIIRGPGVPEDSEFDALVYLYDLYPTLSELAGLPLPKEVDGKSMIKLLQGGTDPIRTSLFTSYRHTVRAVRDREWKLIRYPERDFTQLFHLPSDPLELNNLANQQAYLQKQAEMMVLLKKWQVEVDDTLKLTADVILPLEYDYKSLVRKPDQWQPEYTLKKYFESNREDN